MFMLRPRFTLQITSISMKYIYINYVFADYGHILIHHIRFMIIWISLFEIQSVIGHTYSTLSLKCGMRAAARWTTHEPTTRAAHCIEHLLFAVAEVLPAHQRKHQRGQLRIEQLTLSRTAAVGLVVESA